MMDPAKLGRVIEAMDKRGLAGLLIYSRGATFVLRPSYLHYFSGAKPVGKNTAAAVSRNGNAVLLVEPAWDASRLGSKTWITDVRGTSRFLEDLPALLEELKITGSLGVMGSEEMGVDLHGAVSKQARIEEAGDIVEDLAGEKTERELRVIRETGKIADVGFKAFLKYARVGIREYELLAEMEYAMRSAGADDIFNLVSSGSHNQAMHAPSDRRLAPGDIVIGEITPAREGQFIQLCRTVVLGEPGPVLKEKYAILVEGLKQAMTEIRSDHPASLLSKAMNRVIGDAGYSKYCYPPFMRARGHGFGVGSIAPGAVIDDSTPVNLKRHQVVIAHPNQYFPETGYLACGETVLVTDAGPERLSETETKLYWNEV
jgi:Xaa-Pro aminopeptidase